MWCLTDLWRAGGSPENNRPAEWQRKEGRQFIEFVSENLDVAVGHIVKGAVGHVAENLNVCTAHIVKTDRGLGSVITPSAPSALHR
jgi:hypothetical protein